MNSLGVELELAVLLGLLIFGTEIFAPFEVETSPLRKIFKWSLVVGITLGLYPFVGHWSLAAPIGMGGLGLTVHFVWCRKNGIDPLRATPRRRYYELRGWDWHE